MVYISVTYEVPRDKVQEAFKAYQGIEEFDKKCIEKHGGKLIGAWYTRYGKLNEINLIVAYPSLDAREKTLQSFREGVAKNEVSREAVAAWAAMSQFGHVEALFPASFSPLQ